MATNRTRTRHPRKVEISEQLLATFMRQQTLQQKYHQCCLHKSCVWTATGNGHCGDCRECFVLTEKLRDLAGSLPVWTPDGLADEPEPPKSLIRARTRAAWRRSWTLRQELIKAADARVEATL